MFGKKRKEKIVVVQVKSSDLLEEMLARYEEGKAKRIENIINYLKQVLETEVDSGKSRAYIQFGKDEDKYGEIILTVRSHYSKLGFTTWTEDYGCGLWRLYISIRGRL